MEWDLYYYVSGKKEAPEDVSATSVFQLLKQFVDKRREMASK